MSGLLYRLYAFVTASAVPIAVLVALCSLRGRTRLFERLGFWAKGEACEWWFHGASVGEVTGLLPVIAKIKERYPSHRVLLTAVSPTGLESAKGLVDEVRLLPFDVVWCLRRALRSIVVRRLVITETELWPVLLTEVCQRKIRVDIINGRISDYTVRSYGWVRDLFRGVLGKVSSISAVTEGDVQRYCQLGADPARTSRTGNTKYDIEPVVTSDDEVMRMKHDFFPSLTPSDKIVVLGSIRPGEEAAWFPGIARILKAGGGVKVVVAPRHSEKFDFFAERLTGMGVAWRRWSEPSSSRGDADVVLLDAMGKLRAVYAIADLAFVGATLVDVGGHNPLEPAMYGCAVCVGPYVRVIKEVVLEMEREEAIFRISGPDDAHTLLMQLLVDSKPFQNSGAAARTVWLRYRGATERVLAMLTQGYYENY